VFTKGQATLPTINTLKRDNQLSSGNQSSSFKSDIIKYFPVKIFPGINGIITIYLLTRSLKPENYGAYSFIIATILLFSQLAGGWLNSSIIYFHPDHSKTGTLHELVQSVIKLQMLLCSGTSIGLAIVLWLGSHDYKIVILGFLIMIFQVSQNLIYSFLQAGRKINIQARSTAIQSLTQIIGLIIYRIFFRDRIALVIGVVMLGYLSSTVYAFFKDHFYQFITFNKQKFNRLESRKIIHEVLVYGLPICIWIFANQFYNIGDRIVLKFFHISKGLGNYTSFRDLAIGLSAFITTPILMASHPIIMQVWKFTMQKDEIEEIINHNIRILIVLFTPLIVGTIILGKIIMSRFVGTAYLLDTSFMTIIWVTTLLGGISMYLHKPFEVTNRTFIMSKIAVLTALGSLLLNCLLIPFFGIKASVYIGLIVQLYYCIHIYIASRQFFKLKIQFQFLIYIIIWTLFILGLSLIISLLAPNKWIVTLQIIFFILFTVYFYYRSHDLKEFMRIFIKEIKL
jgi:O-antigen/teichoic acid export membrane protein